MSRRITVFLALVLVIVLGASLTTVHAYQASAADQAQMRLHAAEQHTAVLMAGARADGLSSSELAPLRRQASAIASGRAPAEWAFFRPGLAGFYNRQSRALAALDVSVKGPVRAATARRRLQARSALRQLRTSIATAARLQSSAGAAPSGLAAAVAHFHSATLPKDYAAIAATTRRTSDTLALSYRPEQRFVTDVVAQAHGSIGSLQRQTSAQIAHARSRLPLLGLLTQRAQSYGSALASLDSTTSMARTSFGAAVGDWQAHQLATTVLTDYGKTVPTKMIVVSTEAQSVDVYQNGHVVLTAPVTTGGPELPTDKGVFHIYYKISPFVFHSPFPVGSPYYYLPTPIQYWMPFDGQEGLHDASWRSNFGAGSNYQPTNLGTGHDILGTHGCVNLPLAAAAFIWNFAPVGTTVVVI